MDIMNVLPNTKRQFSAKDWKCGFAVPFKPLPAVQDLRNSPPLCDFAQKNVQIDSVAPKSFQNEGPEAINNGQRTTKSEPVASLCHRPEFFVVVVCDAAKPQFDSPCRQTLLVETPHQKTGLNGCKAGISAFDLK